MKLPKLSQLICLLIALWAIAMHFGCGKGGGAPGRIRVGWQVPWATQGQVVQALKNTNALELNGLEAEFKGFNYGGPLNEAALAGDVDVIFTADQPAATLLAKGGKWTIVGRLMYNRVAIYVPPASPIRSLADLKGKRIAMPFGAAAQRDALKAISEAGLNPAADIKAVNLDIYEQNNIVQKGDAGSWGEIDALVGFDPTPAIFETKGLARMLHVGVVVSLVLMSDAYLGAHPEDARRFLQAYLQAWHFYATHQRQANEWFQRESRLQFDPAVLDIAASVEPNVRARSVRDLRPLLNQDDLKTAQSAASFLRENGMAGVEVSMSEHYDPRHMDAAWRHLTSAGDVELRVKEQ